jgi:hypothetical protein
MPASPSLSIELLCLTALNAMADWWHSLIRLRKSSTGPSGPHTGKPMRTLISERITDRITDGVAVGAVSSPLWLDTFMNISEFFGALLPIVGTLWITYQMITHILTSRAEGNAQGRHDLKQEQKDDKDGV